MEAARRCLCPAWWCLCLAWLTQLLLRSLSHQDLLRLRSLLGRCKWGHRRTGCRITVAVRHTADDFSRDDQSSTICLVRACRWPHRDLVHHWQPLRFLPLPIVDNHKDDTNQSCQDDNQAQEDNHTGFHLIIASGTRIASTGLAAFGGTGTRTASHRPSSSRPPVALRPRRRLQQRLIDSGSDYSQGHGSARIH